MPDLYVDVSRHAGYKSWTLTANVLPFPILCHWSDLCGHFIEWLQQRLADHVWKLCLLSFMWHEWEHNDDRVFIGKTMCIFVCRGQAWTNLLRLYHSMWSYVRKIPIDKQVSLCLYLAYFWMEYWKDIFNLYVNFGDNDLYDLTIQWFYTSDKCLSSASG
jgi:hypothetical protein